MKIRSTNLIRLSLCSTLLLACASCSSSMSDASNDGVQAGAIAVTSDTAIATVTAVDAKARTVTLKRADGQERTYHCGNEVVNFNQIKAGDRVSATITDSVAVFMRKSSDPVSAGEASSVALSPIGSKPGVVMANTAEVNAKILAVDQYAGTITIETPNEMTTLKVGPGVDLTKFKKGDEVTLRVSESLALLVEAPAAK